MLLSINPATGQELARFAQDGAAEIEAALVAAATAQTEWRRSPVSQRVVLLRSLASVLLRRKEDLARLITLEMGKPLTESESEVEKCALNCAFYADMAPGLLADRPVISSATESHVVFEPLGVVLAIMPWNYPLWQFFRFAAPALAAGNGVILKHANNVPQCALAIQRVIEEAGCPAGLVKTLLIEPVHVQDIIADDRIAAVTLTGSTEVGAIVAAQAGKALKKQVLELGGSDPFIVLGDADVERAAEVAVKARFTNAGQSCVSAKRFLVERSIADRFVDRFVAHARELTIGDPMERNVSVGPMARANLRDSLHRQVEQSVASGAILRLGGAPHDGPGYYYPPTILDGVTAEMSVATEETFGPVAAVIRIDDDSEAVRLANDTPFGLGAAIWTGNIERGRALAREIDAGAVFINAMVASDPRLPFGGIKKSGYGRELGDFGLLEFVNVKTLSVGSPQSAAAVRHRPSGESS